MWGQNQRQLTVNREEGAGQTLSPPAPWPRLQPPKQWEINVCCRLAPGLRDGYGSVLRGLQWSGRLPWEAQKFRARLGSPHTQENRRSSRCSRAARRDEISNTLPFHEAQDESHLSFHEKQAFLKCWSMERRSVLHYYTLLRAELCP